MYMATGMMVVCLSLGTVETEKKEGLVKELPIKVESPARKAVEPLLITSAEELAKTIKDEATRKKVAEAVDFSKQKLVLFSWSGSGQDKLTFEEKKGDKGLIVDFTLTRGRTRDLRTHTHLFLLPKEATLHVSTDGK
jgi:hypothetical protein